MLVSNDEAVELIMRMNKGDMPPYEKLGALGELTKLDLSGKQIDNLRFVSGLTKLRNLNLSWTPITSINGLERLTELRRLDISGTQVDNLEPIKQLTNLQTLLLFKTRVEDIGALCGLTKLRTLSLAETNVNSTIYLSDLTSLHTLWLNGTQVDSVDALDKLVELRTLSLNGTRVSSLDKLSSLPKLECLGISRTSLDYIPKWVVDKKLPFRMNDEWGGEPGVYMKDVSLSNQPVWLFSQCYENIEKSYQFATTDVLDLLEQFRVFKGKLDAAIVQHRNVDGSPVFLTDDEKQKLSYEVGQIIQCLSQFETEHNKMKGFSYCNKLSQILVRMAKASPVIWKKLEDNLPKIRIIMDIILLLSRS